MCSARAAEASSPAFLAAAIAVSFASAHVNLSDADKIDVYDQIQLNWDEFVEYVWGFRKPRKSRTKKKPDTTNENDAEKTDHE